MADQTEMTLLDTARTWMPRRPRDLYQVRLATDVTEVRAAQRLRFTVFNLELQEGLASAYATGCDADIYDDCCDHLLIIHQPSEEIVGTYRLQTGAIAALHHGYYSAREFYFHPYEKIRDQLVELGRACVHRDHRNMNLLNLLWRGIARYATDRQARYLIGCSSLTCTNAAVGVATYHALPDIHRAAAEWQTYPHPPYRCVPESFPVASMPIPKLLRAYLHLGAKICGPPALDKEFKTIDFLTLLDLTQLDPAARDRYLK